MSDTDKKVLEIIQSLYQLCTTIYDLQPEGYANLENLAKGSLNQIADLARTAPERYPIDESKGLENFIPVQVLELIDKGKNPDVYTWECLKELLQYNEMFAGKLDAIQEVKKELNKES